MIYIYINSIFNSAIKQVIYMFLAKTSRFIVITVPLTNETVD
jgi:membrane protein YqaA with SNARE-associated domain